MEALSKLPLQRMSERHSGLTEAVAAYYEEAARVCLDRHHASPKRFAIRNGDAKQEAEVLWEQTDERCRAAWANEVDATEAGAYGCAIAAAELTQGLFAIRRAETGTGADYYVAPPGHGRDDLEECLRLEVSGVDHGAEAIVEQRLRGKLDQAAGGRSNLPAMAGVVGFRVALILMQRVE